MAWNIPRIPSRSAPALLAWRQVSRGRSTRPENTRHRTTELTMKRSLLVFTSLATLVFSAAEFGSCSMAKEPQIWLEGMTARPTSGDASAGPSDAVDGGGPRSHRGAWCGDLLCEVTPRASGWKLSSGKDSNTNLSVPRRPVFYARFRSFGIRCVQDFFPSDANTGALAPAGMRRWCPLSGMYGLRKRRMRKERGTAATA